MEQSITMNISDAAKIVGVTATTIRNWEKAGLIAPSRSSNQYRVFTGKDIERLIQIKKLSVDKKLNLTTIVSLLGKEYAYKTGEAPGVTRSMLGEKWQKDRCEKGLSLAEVAEGVGISASYLAKIEAAQANVSYDVLERLAHFYGENPLYYFKSADTETTYASTGPKETLTIGLEGVNLTSYTALQNARLTVMIYDIEPSSGRPTPNAHHGEEFIYILEGAMHFQLADQLYKLNQGDTLHYFSAIPHHWKNPSETVPAKMLWVYTREGEV